MGNLDMMIPSVMRGLRIRPEREPSFKVFLADAQVTTDPVGVRTDTLRSPLVEGLQRNLQFAADLRGGEPLSGVGIDVTAVLGGDAHVGTLPSILPAAECRKDGFDT